MSVSLSVKVRGWQLIAFGGLLVIAVGLWMLSMFGRADASATDESTVVPVTPFRILDTRPAPDGPIGGTAEPIGQGQTRTVQVAGVGAVPAGATGVVVNITALNATIPTYLTAYPNGAARPLASNVNPTPGGTFFNSATVLLGADGRLAIYNNSGSVDVVVDVSGYLTDSTVLQIESRLAAVEAVNAQQQTDLAAAQTQITTLQSTLAGVTRTGNTLTMSGINVQVVDGTGTSACGGGLPEACNGLGNLIIGYNEASTGTVDRSGSHNLVVGDLHQWTSFGGAVFGSANDINGSYATVTGGGSNAANGVTASVTGGFGNQADGISATVTGGAFNQANGVDATVAGGFDNQANGVDATVAGGFGNQANAGRASVAGGDNVLCATSDVCGEGTITIAD